MKISYILFCLCLLLLSDGKAQEIRLQFHDQFSSFRACRAFDDGVMLAAGERGRMIRSTDLGENWRQIETGSVAHFTSMSFARDFRGIIANDSGQIQLTIDEGDTWKTVFDLQKPIVSVAMIDNDNFYAAGIHGEIWRGNIESGNIVRLTNTGLDSVIKAAFTDKYCAAIGNWNELSLSSNAGNSWQKLKIDDNRELEYCGFVSPTICLITCFDTLVRKSIFFRYNFSTMHLDSVVQPKYFTINDMVLRPNGSLIAGGSFGYVGTSNDDGLTWNIFDTVAFIYSSKGSKLLDNIYGLSYNSRGYGIACGGLQFGSVSTYGNFDKKWTIRTQSPGSQFNTFRGYCGHAFNDDTILIAGSDKSIYRTVDAGATWNLSAPIKSNFSGTFYDMYFVSPMHGYIIGMPDMLKIYCFVETTDGGKTWTDREQYGFRFRFSDSQHGFISEYRRISTNWINPIYYASDDSGETWQPKYFKDLGMFDENGASDSSGYVSPGLFFFFTPQNGAALTSKFRVVKTYYSTEDYGQTFKKVIEFDTSLYISNLYIYSENTVFGLGNRGALIRSDDKGRTWRDLDSKLEGIASMVFLTPKNGIIADYNGSIAISTDGGEHWQKINAPNKKTNYEKYIDSDGDNYLDYGAFRVNDTTAYLLGSGRVIRMNFAADLTQSASKPLFVSKQAIVFPNPAKDFFRIECVSSATIKIRDIFGQLAVSGSSGDKFSTNSLANGLYFVELHYDNSNIISYLSVVINR